MVNIFTSAMYATADVALLLFGMGLFLFGLAILFSALNADYTFATWSEALKYLTLTTVWFLVFIFLGVLAIFGLLAMLSAHPILIASVQH